MLFCSQVSRISNQRGVPGAPQMPTTTSVKNCIQLASCGVHEILPMNPDLPADLFTSCLTTPIKIALKWYVLQNASQLLPGIDLEILDKHNSQ